MPELDLSQCCSFIDQLERMEVFQINFGGGEPLLREDFLDILSYAHSKGITTCMSTNGTVHDAGLAKKLAAMELLRIQVSLDGATEDTNDAIRGAGTFKRIIAGIELLLKHDFPHLSINTVVTSTNFCEICQLRELARHFGVKTRLSRFRPSGNGKSTWYEYRLDNKQLLELSDFLNTHLEILTGDSFFSITNENRRKLGLNICGAARMTCSVLSDGRVYPCAFLQEEPFEAGDITRESLEEIWLHAPVFAKMRAIRIEACENCPRFSLCNGGCPAVAYHLTNSLNQADPECLASFRGEILHHVETV